MTILQLQNKILQIWEFDSYQAPEPAAPGGTTEDAQAAMEWVYAEHDAQMQGLKARMEAERIEQRARMEARLKARKERQASERSAQ